MTIEDKSRQHQPIQLNYIERMPVERGMRLVENDDGFRLIYQRRPRWVAMVGPITCSCMGCSYLVAGVLIAKQEIQIAPLLGTDIGWSRLLIYWGLPGAAFLIAGLIVLIRESQRHHQPNQLGNENGKLIYIRDGTWRTRRREISLADVGEVRLKELRSVIPWRKKIEIVIHLRGRWQVAWRKRFGGKNMALGRRFYELLVEAVEVQNKAGPPP